MKGSKVVNKVCQGQGQELDNNKVIKLIYRLRLDNDPSYNFLQLFCLLHNSFLDIVITVVEGVSLGLC